MHALIFTNGDYRILAQEWWKVWHGDIVPPLESLSTMGIVILGDKGPVLISHLMPAATASVVWMGFTVASPFVSKLTIGRALKLLLPAVDDATRRMGYRIVYTGFDSTSLQKLFAKNGYHSGGQVLEQWKVV